MNRERVRKWVDALRSGEYVQGQGRLKDDEGKMCCLGVLCDISGVGRWVAQGDVNGVLNMYRADDKQSWTTLPEPVQEWIGLGDKYVTDNPMVFLGPEEDRWISLATLNDEKGASFYMIADLVERQWLSDEDV